VVAEVAVVVAVVAAVAEVAAVAGGDRRNAMNTNDTGWVRARGWSLAVLVSALLLGTGAATAAQKPAAQKPAAQKPAAQKHFATPDEALDALVAAARSGEEKALFEALGPEAKPLLHSGDPVADREELDRFVHAYDEAHALQKVDDKTVVAKLGKDEWEMPIPIVKDDAGWRFDTDAGDEEILARRIGRNERSTIQACLAYVDAQREYYTRNADGIAPLHYAQRILSTAGKRDGLYWEEKEGEEPSPLGPGFARAKAEGYKQGAKGKPTPFHGYYYRILTGQGPHAQGGAYDYLAKGFMIGGFALVAYPAQYGSSGVTTFLVNHDGVVYEKDLGPKTQALADAMKTFDPAEGWTKVADEEEDAPPTEAPTEAQAQ
jgi:hypothetical protein